MWVTTCWQRIRRSVVNPVWLRREGDHAVVSVEIDGQWVEVIRELIQSPFSHIWEGNDPRLTVTVSASSASGVQYKPCEICTTQSWCETHGCQCYPVSAVQPERCCLDYPRCDCNSPPEPDNAPTLQPCGHPWKAQHDFKCILCSSPGDATYAQLAEEQRFRRSTMYWHERAMKAEARLAEAERTRLNELHNVITTCTAILQNPESWRDEVRDLKAWATSRASVKATADSASGESHG